MKAAASETGPITQLPSTAHKGETLVSAPPPFSRPEDESGLWFIPFRSTWRERFESLRLQFLHLNVAVMHVFMVIV